MEKKIICPGQILSHPSACCWEFYFLNFRWIKIESPTIPYEDLRDGLYRYHVHSPCDKCCRLCFRTIQVIKGTIPKIVSFQLEDPCVGPLVLSVEATPEATITWQRQTQEGAPWSNFTPSNPLIYQGPFVPGEKYRVIVTNFCGQVISPIITVGEIEITGLDYDFEECDQSAEVLVNACSDDYQVQWESSTDETNWNPIPGATDKVLNYDPTLNGFYIRATVSSSYGADVGATFQFAYVAISNPSTSCGSFTADYEAFPYEGLEFALLKDEVEVATSDTLPIEYYGSNGMYQLQISNRVGCTATTEFQYSKVGAELFKYDFGTSQTGEGATPVTIVAPCFALWEFFIGLSSNYWRYRVCDAGAPQNSTISLDITIPNDLIGKCLTVDLEINYEINAIANGISLVNQSNVVPLDTLPNGTSNVFKTFPVQTPFTPQAGDVLSLDTLDSSIITLQLRKVIFKCAACE